MHTFSPDLSYQFKDRNVNSNLSAEPHFPIKTSIQSAGISLQIVQY